MAHNFRGDWQMLWREIGIGFLLAGFIAQYRTTCSVACPAHRAGADPGDRGRRHRARDRGPELRALRGNVPLAAVLWSGGISFAGVLVFLFADLIGLPIVAIYRKYYGTDPASPR